MLIRALFETRHTIECNAIRVLGKHRRIFLLFSEMRGEERGLSFARLLSGSFWVNTRCESTISGKLSGTVRQADTVDS